MKAAKSRNFKQLQYIKMLVKNLDLNIFLTITPRNIFATIKKYLGKSRSVQVDLPHTVQVGLPHKQKSLNTNGAILFSPTMDKNMKINERRRIQENGSTGFVVWTAEITKLPTSGQKIWICALHATLDELNGGILLDDC